MSFTLNDTPFRVQIRPDPGLEGAIVLQFEVLEGMGVLGLRKVGRDEPQPAVHYEESEIEAESLRAGRFVHLLAGGGNRQSYALSRIGLDLIRRLPADAWTELKPVTEYGFRYLVVPEELAARPVAAASVQVAAHSPAHSPPHAAVAIAAAGPAVATVGIPAVRPAPVPRPSAPPGVQAPGVHGSPAAGGLGSGPLPPRQVAMEPGMAQAAFDRLDRGEAIEALKTEMAKVELLHQRLGELERALDQSRSREHDLLQVLARWQQM